MTNLRKQICAGFVLLTVGAMPVFAELDAQPQKKNAYLVDKDRQRIKDSEFAGLIKNLLIKNNQTNARDAKLLFQQCFGGGMLDDIQKALANVVKWVGGSAARHDQCAHDFQGGGFSQGFWTQSLTPQLNNPDQTVLQALDKTATNLKPLIGKIETAQSVSANNGATITLKDPQAQSHHAILWGGQADKGSHFKNIESIRDALIRQWGQVGQKVSITTLFADGKKNFKGEDLPAAWNAKAATKANLIQAFTDAAKVMNPNEQFFFYATGHGSESTAMLDFPKGIARSTVDVELLELFPGELEGIFAQPDNIPTLTFQYTDLLDPVPVYFNNSFLGMLNPLFSFTEFSVPEYLIQPENEVRIENFTQHDFILEAKEFTTGAIDTLPTPEPRSLAPFASGLIGFGIVALRRRFKESLEKIGVDRE